METKCEMGVFVAGLVGIIVFYLAILAVGIWASRKAKDHSEEEIMLAGRNLGFTVGTMTLIATWVGGGYINGAAEVMFSSGLLWAQVPIGYSIALFVGALLFVKPMRDMMCVTLLDPFQRKYGDRIGALLFIPSIFGDFFWVGSILNALGSSLVVITELDPIVSVVLSACFVAFYTSVGAMYSVTYTDIAQMFFILFGLVLSAPFVATTPYLESITAPSEVDWLGSIKKEDVCEWVDVMLLLILGGIPWQGYMQRILAIKSTRSAQNLSMLSMFGCMTMAIPPAYIGVVARSVNWETVPGFEREVTARESGIILPLVLRYLTPSWVAFFGLGAISAAVMSSADSSVLAFSAMFSRNLYKNLFRAEASEKEILWVLRATVLAISALSAVIALKVSSIYYLSVLSSDLIYVILFPQLLLVVYWEKGVNSYGCLASYFIGGVLRILGGEPGLGIPSVIKYPNYDYEKNKQRFPHRTLAMLISLVVHIVASYAANLLFTRNILSEKYDILKWFNRDNEERSRSATITSNEEHRKDGKSAPDSNSPAFKRIYSSPTLPKDGYSTNKTTETLKDAENSSIVRTKVNETSIVSLQLHKFQIDTGVMR